MANLTNEQIVDLYEGLSKISEDKELKFKATLSFALAKNRNLLKPVYDSIMEARQRLIEKYGERNDEGWLIPNDRIESFRHEFEALMFTKTYATTEEIVIEAFSDERIGTELMEKLLPIIIK